LEENITEQYVWKNIKTTCSKKYRSN